MSDMDDRIVKEIKEVLDKEMSESAMDINADSRDGFVNLSGFVDTLAEKRAAEELATVVSHVKGIENGITISTDGTITDKAIESGVINKLRTSRHKDRLMGVSAGVSKGTAILKGSVETLRDKRMAVNEAEKTLGVRDVVANIGITTEGKFADEVIENELTRSLLSKGLSTPDIFTEVEKGTVKITGHVDNRHDMETAVEVAEDIEGVVKVINRLRLR